MIYRLEHFTEFQVIARSDAYYSHKIELARAELLKSGLQFNSKTGVTSENGHWIERPSNPAEHNPADYEDRDSVWDNYFNRHICSHAARLANLERM